MPKPLLDRSDVPRDDREESSLKRLAKVMGNIPLDIFTAEGIKIRKVLREKVGRFRYSGGNRTDVWFKWYYHHDDWSLVDLRMAADYIQETMGYDTLLEEGKGRKPITDWTEEETRAFERDRTEPASVKWVRLRIIDTCS